MKHILILDDETNARLTVRNYLSKQLSDSKIIEASSVSEALSACQQYPIDLAFLDVNLGDGTSFDFLNQLGLDQINFKIIFISAFDHYAINAFKFNAADYILKPINPMEFNAALDKVLSQTQPTALQMKQLDETLKSESIAPSKVVLKDQNTIQLVELNDILYCQSDNNYTVFHLTDGSQMIVSQTLKEYDTLLRKKHFFRAHRSYLINLHHLRKYDKREGGSIEMTDGTQIPLARAKRETLMNLLS